MTYKPRVAFLLPMKRNSERVPNKNFRIFSGKPLYRWMLDTIVNLEFVSQVVVNTDAAELIDLPKGDVKYGRVLIRDRRPEICGDLVSMNKVIEDDLRAVDADIYLMSHTTNPLLSERLIQSAFLRFCDGVADGFDSLFTVNKVQARFYSKAGAPLNHNPEELLRTQDLEPMYEENSCLYIFTRKSFESSGARIGIKPILHETDKVEAQDIDTEDDWLIAEAIAQRGRR